MDIDIPIPGVSLPFNIGLVFNMNVNYSYLVGFKISGSIEVGFTYT